MIKAVVVGIVSQLCGSGKQPVRNSQEGALGRLRKMRDKLENAAAKESSEKPDLIMRFRGKGEKPPERAIDVQRLKPHWARSKQGEVSFVPPKAAEPELAAWPAG